VLSHPQVIEKLNSEFIPLEINLSDQPWPSKEFPCLWPWKMYHEGNPLSKFGFTAIILLSPDGKRVLGSAQSAAIPNWKNSEHYHADKLLVLLDAAVGNVRK